MTTVLLCRHGETAWNRERRVQGWAPTSLTDRGCEQSGALADHVAAGYDVDRVVASDLERAAETARVLGRAVGADPELDPAWRERDFGRLQGLSYADLFEGYPEYALGETGHAAAEATPEGGESLLAMRERVLTAWEGLLAEAANGVDGVANGEPRANGAERTDRAIGADRTVAVVTHGGPLYAVTGAVKGLDLVAATLEQEQGNCALNEVRVRDGDATLVAENETGFQAEATVQRNY
ncbi:histidine phosphatase family protein [Halorarum salinum]|uniref:Histidine phosphatase family protein n=1 Tax=Halorarum salinum TaxID=2743089 RepID=A0A7D5Q8D5_9EURY|nr:histidine phosphatase family protein [Halobaculum salinum]QLG60856.1 histidine phosphatase family protein [Halobaculum salinum]